MMNFIALFLIIFFSYTTQAEQIQPGCAADPIVQNAEYILKCNPNDSTCKCPDNYVSAEADYYLSVPLRGYETLRCEPPGKTASAVKNAVRLINIGINRVTKKINADNCEDSEQTIDPILAPIQMPKTDGGFDISNYIENQTYRFNDGCGYNLKIRASAINDFIETALTEGPEKACMVSMCTTASYTVFLMALEELKSQNKLPAHINLEELKSTRSEGWNYFNNMARPDLAMFELGIGSGRTLNPSDIESCSTKDWPRGGDFVQLWRENGSGHSVVFSDYLKNDEGKVVGLCYWSSNLETRGLDHRCESIDKMTKIIVGRITL